MDYNLELKWINRIFILVQVFPWNQPESFWQEIIETASRYFLICKSLDPITGVC